MKTLLLLTLLASPLTAFADDPVINAGPSVPPCSNNFKDISADPAAIQAAIKGAQFCWQAVQLAENCASGEGIDVSYVAAAAPLCEKEFESNKPTSQDRILLASMRSACDDKWKSKEGGEAQSKDSLCKLNAWLWLVNLTGANG
ncbi:MAG: hypothetical protein ACXVB9_01280 [Bdellovibrionota bacterium]